MIEVNWFFRTKLNRNINKLMGIKGSLLEGKEVIISWPKTAKAQIPSKRENVLLHEVE